jgi:hypothetical protein
MTDTERQEQLDDVVENGMPVVTTPNYSNWNPATGTRTLCENDSMILTITPSIRTFDGYNPTVARSSNISFGSVALSGGEHLITFTAVGKNASSTGYGIGIDCFGVAPSGCLREAELSSVYADGGGSKLNEDMSAYGSWSGNRHLEYQAGHTGDYVSLIFYYDQWLEANFATCSPDYTFVEYSSRTGDGAEAAGNSDYLARLAGFGDSWSALAQTGAAGKTSETVNIAGSEGIIFRDVVLSKDIEVEGRAARITFDNMSGSDLNIDYASIMARSSGPDGEADSLKRITFYDAGGGESVTIPAATSVNSDWIDVSNFNREKDYLVTAHLSLSAGSHTVSGYVALDTASVHSYVLEGDAEDAGNAAWTGKAYTTKNAIYMLDSIDASYFSGGTLTSQIYDTGIADPAYDKLRWIIVKNNFGEYGAGGLGANLVIKLRSNDDNETLSADTDWSDEFAVSTNSAVTGEVSLSGVGNGRFVQFRAEFHSQPTVGKHDYLKSCALKEVSVNWPGETRMVDVSGYFTKRPNYGIFSVKVDGRDLIKGLEVALEIEEKMPFGKRMTRSLTAESEPRNTGK